MVRIRKIENEEKKGSLVKDILGYIFVLPAACIGAIIGYSIMMSEWMVSFTDILPIGNYIRYIFANIATGSCFVIFGTSCAANYKNYISLALLLILFLIAIVSLYIAYVNDYHFVRQIFTSIICVFSGFVSYLIVRDES